MTPDPKNRLTRVTAVLPAIITTTTTSSAIDLLGFIGNLEFILASNKGTGNADNTNTVTVTQCATSGGSYVAVTGGAFTAVDGTTSSVQSIPLSTRYLMRFVKIVQTLAGTNPSYASTVLIQGEKQTN
jgi:hypothetical protein